MRGLLLVDIIYVVCPDASMCHTGLHHEGIVASLSLRSMMNCASPRKGTLVQSTSDQLSREHPTQSSNWSIVISRGAIEV